MFQTLVGGQIPSPDGGHSAVPGTPNIGQYGEYNKKYTKLHEGLDSSISVEGKSRIERILNDIQLLTDVEKLLLYLKLPTGIPKDEYLRSTPPSCLPVSNRREQGEAMTWIKSHLEEHEEVCMPKAEVYEEYKQFCTQHELRPLCNADFGKVMKTVFPDINTRRLGQRGQSKYFYGGLRKKLEHALPGLPELEIHSKITEVDHNNAHTEVFKASCKLICEWADKLLDNKFTGVQAVAEHLVSSMYVNTKSVAAFTLIAAMQETGNTNLKGSALFTSQAISTVDKHKETNLLLQQKLQKNKMLHKQKEKLQAMKEENENQQGPVLSSPSDRKTCTSQSRKSTTPSKMSRTPKLQSHSPSPAVLQSPRIHPSSIGIPSTDQMVTMAATTSDLVPLGISMSLKNDPINTATYMKSSTLQNAFKESLDDDDLAIATESRKIKKENVYDRNPLIADVNMIDGNERSDTISGPDDIVLSVMVDNDRDKLNPLPFTMETTSLKESGLNSNRETPYTELEGNSNMMSHVRKISFDDIDETSSEQLKDSTGSSEHNKAEDKTAGGKSATIEMLSKSAGHMSLKMLLERKDETRSNLNKSTGLLEKSKNTLLVNQSNVAGRSAFVPFAQVQQPRRDLGEVNQSTILSIPNTFTSKKSTYPPDKFTTEKAHVCQTSSIAMITVPQTNTPNQDQQQVSQRLPDNIIKIFPGSAAVKLSSNCGGNVSVAYPFSDGQTVSSSAKNSLMDSLAILTPSKSLATSSNSEMIVTSVPNSPGMSKHLRTRFTPIRPKGSPNKVTTNKDSKTDNPVYDKRPVSEILKEKRAKEQAEAFTKFQVGINLPTIPFQPNISLDSGHFGGLQQIQRVGGKEVVIIVNNQTGGNLHNFVNQTSIFKQQVNDTQQSKHMEGNRMAFDTFGVGDNFTSKNTDGPVKETCRGTDYTEGKEDSEADSPDQYKDVQPASSSSEMEVDTYDINVPTSQTQDNVFQRVCTDQEQRDKFEQIYTETPAKIARLNITSPFRPDSACSLGRETPMHLIKPQEPCSSRPDSACSYGRETPSGARKRKSSDYQQRKDFKRLNSTGDEGEDMGNERMLAGLLSPGSEGHSGDSQRRAQSCTFELEKDVRRGVTYLSKTQTSNLPEGLQSPDITSLEEEALIESFPNSLYVMRPHKSQRHSVGVGARSVKMYQQRLLKQKQVLDKRVCTFLQQKKSNTDVPHTKSIHNDGQKLQADFKIPFKNQDVTKDLVGDARHMGVVTSMLSGRIKKLENEPSGLPSDVADWINETIEKRQTFNHSVLSEPELGVLNPQRSSTAIDFTASPFYFEEDQDRARTCRSGGHSDKKVFQSKDTTKNCDDDTFTVPKAPSFTPRVKDLPGRGPPDPQTPSERCQSLPVFTTTSKSPISPVSLPINKHTLYQRAVSMSPRQENQTNLLSPVSGLTSPLRRIDVRDNHPISLNVHTTTSVTASSGGKTRDESFLKFTNYVGKHNPVPMEEGRSQVGSYLASIQHNLQKPKDSSQEHEHTKIRDANFVIPSTNFSKESKVETALPISSQANQTSVLDNSVKLTQFSDSGYQSSGTSPILNSTPVSGIQEDEFNQNRHIHSGLVSESPIYMTSSIQQSTHLAPKVQITFPNMDTRTQFDGITSQTIISSSKHSAFIPIQSSNQTLQFVTPTPIRPSVSLQNQIYQISTSTGNLSNQSSLLIDPNQSRINQDITLISPKDHDPPPYETAVKSLRQTHLKTDSRKAKNDPYNRLTGNNADSEVGLEYNTELHKDTKAFSTDRVSLLANMGKDMDSRHHESFGPFASKLVQLSRQTKASSLKQMPGPLKNASVPVTLTPCTVRDGQMLNITSLLSSNNISGGRVFSDGNSAIHKDGMQGLVGSNKKEYRTQQIEDGLNNSSKEITSNNFTISPSVMGLIGNSQINKDHCGAKGILSPNSGHTAFNMDIEFLHSPDSQSLLHFSSPADHHENVLYSNNPSLHTAINNIHSTSKNISSMDMPTFIHTPASVSNTICVSSKLPLESSHALTQRNSCGDMSAIVCDKSVPNEGFVKRREPVIDPRTDCVDDLPVDLELMLQDLKELESDLLRDGSGLNLGNESHTVQDEINNIFHN